MRNRLPIRTPGNRPLRMQLRTDWLEALSASAACDAVSSSPSLMGTPTRAKNAK
jgi:hypothetical protein